jgi:hypothetical protein
MGALFSESLLLIEIACSEVSWLLIVPSLSSGLSLCPALDTSE